MALWQVSSEHFFSHRFAPKLHTEDTKTKIHQSEGIFRYWSRYAGIDHFPQTFRAKLICANFSFLKWKKPLSGQHIYTIQFWSHPLHLKKQDNQKFHHGTFFSACFRSTSSQLLQDNNQSQPALSLIGIKKRTNSQMMQALTNIFVLREFNKQNQVELHNSDECKMKTGNSSEMQTVSEREIIIPVHGCNAWVILSVWIISSKVRWLRKRQHI